jgi:hypothetical protein
MQLLKRATKYRTMRYLELTAVNTWLLDAALRRLRCGDPGVQSLYKDGLLVDDTGTSTLDNRVEQAENAAAPSDMCGEVIGMLAHGPLHPMSCQGLRDTFQGASVSLGHWCQGRPIQA